MATRLAGSWQVGEPRVGGPRVGRPSLGERGAEALEDEGRLCTALLIASSGAERSLTRDEVDEVLGVRPRSHA